jgi:hypothetical protein
LVETLWEGKEREERGGGREKREGSGRERKKTRGCNSLVKY